MRVGFLILILLGLFSIHSEAQIQVQGSQTQKNFMKDSDFWLATSANIFGSALFISRVHHPQSAKWFALGTKLHGIPALTLGVIDLIKKEPDSSTWANLGYAFWAAGATLTDNILKIEYRDPVRPAIIIPYVTAYYAAIGSQGVAQYRKGLLPWAIVGLSCIVNVSTSFYARAKGADR